MPVVVQPTPNPNAMKFVLPARRFARPVSYASAAAAEGDPMAARIFALHGVYNVFMAQDFVTVNKLPEVDWDALAPIIQRYLENDWEE
ncbi:MAG: NifU N-terminal domain-containing protein [Anaerolineales bacterium]|nr:NifU N-terminal domain-containing protein [Anaerolineales bacterium]